MLYFQMKVNASTRRTLWLMVSLFYCAVQSEYRTIILQQKLQVHTLNSRRSSHVGFLLFPAKDGEGGEHSRHYLTSISCRKFQKRLANCKMSREMLVHAHLVSTCISTCQVITNRIYLFSCVLRVSTKKNIKTYICRILYIHWYKPLPGACTARRPISQGNLDTTFIPITEEYKPTRCRLLFYCISCRVNMFRALLCPSSRLMLITTMVFSFLVCCRLKVRCG